MTKRIRTLRSEVKLGVFAADIRTVHGAEDTTKSIALLLRRPWKLMHELRELRSQLSAVGRSHAIIEFDLGGHVIYANDNFLSMFGYGLEEIKGKHHRLFVDPVEANSAEYQRFWARLAAGIFQSGEFRRFGRWGEEHYIQASYSPLMDWRGRPYKVVKFAMETTEAKLRSTDHAGQVEAVCRSQAVVEFDLNGTVLGANGKFLDLMGYRLEEIQGKHHGMFVDKAERESSEYQRFWEGLLEGIFCSAEFRRVRKDGSWVCLQATYNPIFDPQGRLWKVVKYATDISDQVEQREKFAHLSMVVGATDNSVVITTPDGLVEYANEGFTRLTGYSFQEVQGRKPGEILQGRHTNQDTIKRIREKLRAREPVYEEILNYSKEGNAYWISLAINPVFATDGKLKNFIAIHADMTKTKERALDYQDRMAAIERSNAVVEWDDRGGLLRMNDQAKTLFEVKTLEQATALRRMTYASAISNEEHAALTEGKALTKELTIPLENEMVCHVAATLQPLKDMEGKLRRVVLYATDVTERRRVVEESEAVLKRLIDEIGGFAQDLGEIASLTNLLALNAAIEAAHAGAAGRSFSVLASEVQLLAQRAQRSSGQIESLISNTHTQIALLRSTAGAA